MGIYIPGCLWVSISISISIWISQVLAIGRILLHFPMLWEIHGKTQAFIMWRVEYHRAEISWKGIAILWEKVSVSILQFSTMWWIYHVAASSHATRNWLKASCMCHAIKHTTGWESDGREPPLLWEKYGYHNHRFLLWYGFCWIFSCYEILMGRTMYFPCNKTP